MKVFFDTEFSALPQGHLISLGTIAANGSTFYGEVAPLPPADQCSDFVREHVLPKLCGPQYPLAELRERFWMWLCAFGENVVLIHDAAQDREQILALFGKAKFALHKGNRAFCEHSLLYAPGNAAHHALQDACALRDCIWHNYSKIGRNS